MISFPEHPVFILLNFKEQGLYNYRHVWQRTKNKGISMNRHVMYTYEFWGFCVYFVGHCWFVCSFYSLLWYRLESQCKYNVIHIHLCTGQLDFKTPSIVCDCYFDLSYTGIYCYMTSN
jgi:hypothetical protein